MKITEHFKRREFDCVDPQEGCRDPYPEKWIEGRLRPLCELLELIRAAVAEKIGGRVYVVVTSGYRTKARNLAVGGWPRSQHLKGRAADILVLRRGAGGRVDPALVADVVERIRDDGAFKGGIGRYHGFTHVDVRGRNRSWAKT